MNIKKNVPNILTILGYIIVNVSILIYNKTGNFTYIILMLFGFSFDYMDGYFARKLNVSSKLGNILDKISDKVNQLMLLLLLVSKFKVNILYVGLFILREIIMFTLRKLDKKPVTSSIHGKLKTFIFPVTIILYHFNLPLKQIYLFLLSIYNLITLFL
jgi:CDP-diacylglycerol--glycerol-3-phosphate 3-phosphatidyltransferase